jgi:hypothetical protein
MFGVGFCWCCCCRQVRRKIDLVYGGGSIGLMGKIAETVHAGGNHVIGCVFFIDAAFFSLLATASQWGETGVQVPCRLPAESYLGSAGCNRCNSWIGTSRDPGECYRNVLLFLIRPLVQSFWVSWQTRRVTALTYFLI